MWERIVDVGRDGVFGGFSLGCCGCVADMSRFIWGFSDFPMLVVRSYTIVGGGISVRVDS